MRLSEHIKEMQHLLDMHGDLEVEAWTPALGRRPAPMPELAYRLKAQDGPRGGLQSARGGVNTFWHPTDHPSLKGDPVIRVKG